MPPSLPPVRNFEALKILRAEQPEIDIIEGLIGERTVNLLVGGNTIGKTPLAVAMGVAVASGTPFLGRAVAQGSVLYCDAESGVDDFTDTLGRISHAAGLDSPPTPFHVASPTWDPWDKSGPTMFEIVREVKPRLVVVDPLRIFWPAAPDGKGENASQLFGVLRSVSAATGCSWVIIHHLRKENRDRETPSLVDDPHGWFQDVAGSLALVNHADTRLGLELCDIGDAELIVGGLRRRRGALSPIYLARDRDERDGQPQGYRAVMSLSLLPLNYQEAFRKLPPTFRRADALKLMNGSGSNADLFLRRCLDAQLIRRDGQLYIKAGTGQLSRVA